MQTFSLLLTFNVSSIKTETTNLEIIELLKTIYNETRSI